MNNFSSPHAVSGTDAENDYVGISNQQLVFEIGDSKVCHTIDITDDNDCEVQQIQDFFSNLDLDSGEDPIIIRPERAQVIINDTAEQECGEYAELLKGMM